MGALIERWTTGEGGFLGEVSLVSLDEFDESVYARKNRVILELTDVYVHPLRRGQGWARALVKVAVDHAESEGIDLMLRIIPYSKKAHRKKWGALDQQELEAFYKTFGFKARKDDPRVMMRRAK